MRKGGVLLICLVVCERLGEWRYCSLCCCREWKLNLPSCELPEKDLTVVAFEAY